LRVNIQEPSSQASTLKAASPLAFFPAAILSSPSRQMVHRQVQMHRLL